MRPSLPLTVLRVSGQEGNKTLTLALVWQLMRAYTLSLLSRLNTDSTPIVESEIINWANNKLAEGGKGISIRHFQVRQTNKSLTFVSMRALTISFM